MTPVVSACATSGTGIPTAVAPSAFSASVIAREGARIFLPFRSSSESIGSPVMWNL